MAGYTGTPLARKLGIKAGMRVRFVDPPRAYHDTLGALPEGVVVAGALRGAFDIVQVFASSR